MAELEQKFLDEIFPATRTDAFFDALFGGAEEGAYDIRLVPLGLSDTEARLAFELRQRPGKCLKCSLTYGLPQVFKRHPVLDVAGVARAVGAKLGWQGEPVWDLGATEEVDAETHVIPLRLVRP
ncbi:MAG: hypothetical protein K2G99_00820 [Desulfovibrio sp.]|nr:hypothetical protein [Desulfovibrio sp.]